MDASDSEGLGLSLAIYMAAILGGLALVALPVYFANGPSVYENPPLTRGDPLMNGPIVGQRISGRVPLAVLKRSNIVDPAIVAALNARAQKHAAAHHTPHQVAHRASGTPVAELQAEPRDKPFFLFSLF